MSHLGDGNKDAGAHLKLLILPRFVSVMLCNVQMRYQKYGDIGHTNGVQVCGMSACVALDRSGQHLQALYCHGVPMCTNLTV